MTSLKPFLLLTGLKCTVLQGAFDQFDKFYNTLMELHNKYFPKVRMKKGYSNRKPWLCEALRNCIRCKNK